MTPSEDGDWTVGSNAGVIGFDFVDKDDFSTWPEILSRTPSSHSIDDLARWFKDYDDDLAHVILPRTLSRYDVARELVLGWTSPHYDDTHAVDEDREEAGVLREGQQYLDYSGEELVWVRYEHRPLVQVSDWAGGTTTFRPGECSARRDDCVLDFVVHGSSAFMDTDEWTFAHAIVKEGRIGWKAETVDEAPRGAGVRLRALVKNLSALSDVIHEYASDQANLITGARTLDQVRERAQRQRNRQRD